MRLKMVNSKKVAFIGAIASLAFLLSACNLYKAESGSQSQTGGGQQQSEQIAPEDAVISYSDSGFSPAEIRVKVGQKVVFKNGASANMQINSAVHPTHTLFPELNIGVIAPGQIKSVTFTKAGTYKYHNHLNTSQSGTIVVE